MSTGCSASAHPPAVAACPVAHLPPAPRSMSLDQLAGAITRGRLRGLTSDQGAEACWLSCSAAVFYSYRSAGDCLLYLLDCGSREAVQLGRPVPFPPGQPGYEEMRGMAAANVAQGLRMARVGYPGVIVYQSEDHHLMAFRRSLVLLFDARPTARPPTGGPPTDRPAPAPGGSSPAPRPVAWWRPPWGCNAHTHTATVGAGRGLCLCSCWNTRTAADVLVHCQHAFPNWHGLPWPHFRSCRNFGNAVLATGGGCGWGGCLRKCACAVLGRGEDLKGRGWQDVAGMYFHWAAPLGEGWCRQLAYAASW